MRETGALIWEHRSGIDQNINTVCCGWDNRGVAIGDGKVFLGYLDGNVVALDIKTGQELWKTQIGALAGRLHHHQRAALPQRRDLFRHLRRRPAGARLPGRARRQDRQGEMALLDRAGAGRIRLRHLAEAGRSRSEARQRLEGRRRQHLADAGDRSRARPDLFLDRQSRARKPAAWAATGRATTCSRRRSWRSTLEGKYAWHFQQVHHDLWDFDCPSPVVLFDQMYEGKLRKGIAEACKTGWIYILDRTNGKPLIGIDEKPVEVDARVASSPTQPIPRGDAVMPQCPQPLAPLGDQVHLRRDLRPADPDVAGRQRRRRTGRRWPTARAPATSTSPPRTGRRAASCAASARRSGRRSAPNTAARSPRSIPAPTRSPGRNACPIRSDRAAARS